MVSRDQRSYDRRRAGGHAVEVAGTTVALGAGAGLAGERVRDRYREDKPRTLRRVAARAGPLEGTVRHGRIPPALVAAGALGAATAYGAQRYQDTVSLREIHNTRRREREAKSKLRGVIAARAPQEVIVMETGILAKAARHYRVERHRAQGETAAATGGVIAGAAAGHAQWAKTRHLREAQRARTVFGSAATGSALSAGAGLHGANKARDAYKSAAAAHKAAHVFPDPPDFAREVHVPPKPPRSRPRKGESGDALASRRATDSQRFLDRARSAHEKEQNRLEAAHKARHEAGRPAHEFRVGQEARAAGRRAATWHGVQGVGGFLGSAGGLGTAIHEGGNMRHATKLAARAGRSVHSRGAAAIGLLGAAAALHESKNRKPPARISYAYGPSGGHL